MHAIKIYCPKGYTPRTIVRKAPASASIKVRATMLETINEASNSMYYVSKGIIVFTMLYCGMNYFYYKNLHERYASSKKEKDKDKNI
jgi:hypothetical protein